MTNLTTNRTQTLESRRVLTLAVTGGAIAAGLNLLIWVIAPALSGSALQVANPGSTTSENLTAVPVILASFVPALVGGGVLLALSRFVRQPVRVFQILALVLAVLSLSSPLSLPIDAASKLALGLMHLVAASSITALLSRSSQR